MGEQFVDEPMGPDVGRTVIVELLGAQRRSGDVHRDSRALGSKRRPRRKVLRNLEVESMVGTELSGGFRSGWSMGFRRVFRSVVESQSMVCGEVFRGLEARESSRKVSSETGGESGLRKSSLEL
jgi:hypothetical protein